MQIFEQFIETNALNQDILMFLVQIIIKLTSLQLFGFAHDKKWLIWPGLVLENKEGISESLVCLLYLIHRQIKACGLKKYGLRGPHFDTNIILMLQVRVQNS